MMVSPARDMSAANRLVNAPAMEWQYCLGGRSRLPMCSIATRALGH